MSDDGLISKVFPVACGTATKNGIVQLSPTRNATVQPIALMRLGVFLPSSTKKGVNNSISTIDASEALSGLEKAKAEGYTDIKITGQRLSMGFDFKVWCGCIRAFSLYGVNSNEIELPFSEFISLCGFPPSRMCESFRDGIGASLAKLRGKTINMVNPSTGKRYFSGLLSKGTVDPENDMVKLVGDSELWELYQCEPIVLLQLHAIKAMPRKEVAQALYTFIESLPANPVPLSFERIANRLELNYSTKKEESRAIRRAIAELVDIGYLQGKIEKKRDGENYLLIHGRNPKLKAIKSDVVGSEFPLHDALV